MPRQDAEAALRTAAFATLGSHRAVDFAVDERLLVKLRQRELLEKIGHQLTVAADRYHKLSAAAHPVSEGASRRGRSGRIRAAALTKLSAPRGQDDDVGGVVAVPPIGKLFDGVEEGELAKVAIFTGVFGILRLRPIAAG